MISNAPEEKTGSAASAQEVGGELGSALGIALGGTVSVLVYRFMVGHAELSAVPEQQAEIPRKSVHQGVATAEKLETGGPGLLAAVHDAVTGGQQVFAAGAAVVLSAVAATVFLALVRKPRKKRGQQR